MALITAVFPEGNVSREVTVEPPCGNPPNFLFIAIDDLKPICGFMSENPGNFLNFIYPDPAVRAEVVANLTPNIDQLAQSGIGFHRAYCSTTACRPSRTALMSGFRPYTSGITRNSDVDIRESDNPTIANSITLSQNLKNHGYFTAGCGKIWHHWYDAAADKANSWNAWINPVPDYLAASEGPIQVSEWSPFFDNNDVRMKWGIKLGPTEGQDDYNNAEFIARVIEQGALSADDQSLDIAQSPWFLACGIYRPHLPFYCPQELVDLFNVDDMVADQSTLAYFLADDRGAPGNPDMDDILAQGRQRAPLHGLTDDEGEIRAYKECIRYYFGSVALADRCVGRLLEALDNSPYANNTVVVLWSDHGWFLGEKYRWRKTTNYDEAANCVLVIRDPRPGLQASGGTPCYRTVNLQDLYRTIMTLADVPVPSHVEGYDISPLLLDPRRAWNIPALSTWGTSDHGLRFGEWSYLRDGGNIELYHLPTDPDERNDLSNLSQHAGIIDVLDELLDRVVAGDAFPERNDDSFQNWRLGFSSWPQPNDDTDRDSDPNGNGINNFGEYLRYGDPFALGSLPHLIELLPGANAVRFPFRGRDENLRYRLRQSDALLPGVWPVIWDSDSDLFDPAETLLELPVSNGVPVCFWQLDVKDQSAP